MRDDLIPAIFHAWRWVHPPPAQATRSTRRMLDAPEGYEINKRYLLPRTETQGKRWWAVIDDDPRETLVTVEFQPIEQYMIYPENPDKIRVPIKHRPGNYEDGKTYMVPKAEVPSESNIGNPWWSPA
jgi:hypothetical protein